MPFPRRNLFRKCLTSQNTPQIVIYCLSNDLKFGFRQVHSKNYLIIRYVYHKTIATKLAISNPKSICKLQIFFMRRYNTRF